VIKATLHTPSLEEVANGKHLFTNYFVGFYKRSIDFN